MTSAATARSASRRSAAGREIAVRIRLIRENLDETVRREVAGERQQVALYTLGQLIETGEWGLNKTQIAERAGMSRSQYQALTRGKRAKEDVANKHKEYDRKGRGKSPARQNQL